MHKFTGAVKGVTYWIDLTAITMIVEYEPGCRTICIEGAETADVKEEADEILALIKEAN